MIVGGFLDLDTITALPLVSRQIYKETSGLMWKVNTFHFDGEPIRGRGPIKKDRTERITEAHSFFLRNIGTQAINLLRSISFEIDFPAEDKELECVIHSVTALAKRTPAAKVQLRDRTWEYIRGFNKEPYTTLC
jgi:hypothetical protein